MLRIVFGRQDLQQVRLAAAPDPMWELLLGVQCVQANRVAVHQVAWHRVARRQLAAAAEQRWWATLCALIPVRGDFPDFLTPAPFSADLDSGCEKLACTASSRFRLDISSAFASRHPAPWVRSLATGDRDEVRNLVGAVRTGYQTLIAPHSHQARRAVAADRGTRVRTLVEQGVGRFLAGLPGVLGWDDRVLTLRYPKDRTLGLAGRGLTVIPSYFCAGTPVTLIDPTLQPALVYPARHPAGPTEPGQEVPAALVRLLSRTRAECLHQLVEPGTTSQLAARLRVAIGSASKQATILRNAGLINSTRHGGAVVHQITALGSALLSGGLDSPSTGTVGR